MTSNGIVTAGSGSIAWQCSKRFDSVDFCDITEFLTSATQHLSVSIPIVTALELKVGQIVNLSHFGLWEAMSAIEIMDPKMDNGMASESERKGDQYEVSQIPSISITASEIIGVMDVVYSKMDDELSFSSGGFGMADNTTDNECLTQLTQCEDDLIAPWKEARKKAELKGPFEVSLGLPPGKELECLEALLARVRFQRALHTALFHISKRNLPSAKKSLAQAIMQIQLCELSSDIGTQMSRAFDPNLNRKMMQDTAPRSFSEISVAQAFADFSKMCNQLLELISLPSDSGLATCLVIKLINQLELKPKNLLKSFMKHFSFRTGYPNIVVRSVYVRHTLHGDKLHGKISLQAAIRQAIISRYDPAFLSSTDDEVNRKVEEFLPRAERAVLELCRLYGWNRSRQRRKAFKLVIYLEELQAETESIDCDIQALVPELANVSRESPPYYLSSWVYELKLSLMADILLMGFELNIFSDFESSITYWYLESVLEAELVHFERMKQIGRLFGQNEDSSGKPKKNSKVLPPKTTSTETLDHDVYESITLAKQLLARGLHLTTSALIKASILKQPDPEFYDEKLHFHYRFRVMNSLGSPRPATYEMFRSTQSGVERASFPILARMSTICFSEAKLVLDQLVSDMAKFAQQPAMDYIMLQKRQQDVNDLVETTNILLDTVATGDVDGAKPVPVAWDSFAPKVQGSFENWNGGRILRWKLPGFPIVSIRWAA
ncbi:N-alpha-acetyltransferase 35 NatC auxiliary subunit [Blyttiomyces sp. JEL0837]|nr:N-alpha-acetyltransferase 35 NatC auxiliary subunit [Blyttiomyces sp. JEL0837]